MHQNILSLNGGIQRSEERSRFLKWCSSWFCFGNEYFRLSKWSTVFVPWFPHFKNCKTPDKSLPFFDNRKSNTSLKAVKYRWKYERKLWGLPQHNTRTHVLQPLENACPMREECSGLDSPLFQRKHCKTEGLCKFPRCVEQNCFRCVYCLRCIMPWDYAFLWSFRSRRKVCRCVTVESSRTTTTIPPTITTAKTITSPFSLRAWPVITSSQTETLPTPHSQFQIQRKNVSIKEYRGTM